MKSNNKGKADKGRLFEYMEKLKLLNKVKNSIIKALNNYLKKVKKIMFISLFFAMHGVGIIGKSIWMLGNPRGINVLLGISSRVYSDLGFIIGIVLIINAVGLMTKKKIFYYSALAIVFSFMVYISISLVRIKEMYVASMDFSVIVVSIFYLILYGAVFGNMLSLQDEI
jgi:hypothetical protein